HNRKVDESTVDAVDVATSATEDADALTRTTVIGVAFNSFQLIPNYPRDQAGVSVAPTRRNNEDHSRLHPTRVVQGCVVFDCTNFASLPRPVPEIENASGLTIFIDHWIRYLKSRCRLLEAEEHKSDAPRLAEIDSHGSLIFVHSFSAVAPWRFLQHSNLPGSNVQDLGQ